MTRRILSLIGLIALVTLLASPGALAHIPPDLEATEDPHGNATLAGFAPAVVPLRDGDRLTWSSLDVAHTFTEGLGSTAPSPCVDAPFSAVSPAGATFTITDGVLAADGDTTDDQAPVACQTAEIRPHLATMGFYCEFHPWMNGLLVVYDPIEHSPASALNDPAVLLQRDALAGMQT